MEGTLSVVLSDCFKNEMKRDDVSPIKPKFYERFVDDIYRRRKRNETDNLFDKMNFYHSNIKLTIKIRLQKFLGIKILRTSNKIQCFIYQKENKRFTVIRQYQKVVNEI